MNWFSDAANFVVHFYGSKVNIFNANLMIRYFLSTSFSFRHFPISDQYDHGSSNHNFERKERSLDTFFG